MKRLGENSITAGRERWLIAALLLMYAYLLLLHINANLWFKLLVVYFPCVLLLLLLTLLPRIRGEKIELKIILIFAAWMIFTRILNWDIKDYIERCRTGGITYPDDALLIAGSMMTYLPMAACLTLRGRSRARFLDGIAIITVVFSTVLAAVSLYAVLYKTPITAPFGNGYLCLFVNSRLYVLGKNPNTCCMWFFLGFFFLVYLFSRARSWLRRVLIVPAALLNYVILAMTFSRNGMLSFSLCMGFLVLVLLLRLLSPKAAWEKLLCTVLVLGLLVPLTYKSFGLLTRGMENISNTLIEKRDAAQTPPMEEDGGAEVSGSGGAATLAYMCFGSADREVQRPQPLLIRTEGASLALLASDGVSKDNGSGITYEDHRGFDDSGRIEIFKTIIPTMQNEPLRLLIGCLDKNAMQYAEELLSKDVLNFHNTFLQILCLTGAIGLLLVLAFCVLLGRRVLRVIYSDAPMTVSILALMLVGVLFYNMLEVDLFISSDAVCFAAYAAAGAVLAHSDEHHRRKPGKYEKPAGRHEKKPPAAG